MTATTVNGQAVMASEPVESPISRPGRPVFFPRILRLLLADETETLGCKECDFVDPRIGRVRVHLREHKVEEPEAQPTPEPRGLKGLTVDELVSRARQADVAGEALLSMTDSRNQWRARAVRAERTAADRDQWKQRAVRAEGALATLRAVLA